MKRRSKGASPNGGFLYFRPVEFLEQSSYSSLGAEIEFWSRAPILLWELRLNVEPSRSGTTVMGTLPPRRADEECLRSFAAERNRPCPCPPRNREPADRRLSTFGRITFRGELTKKRARSAEETRFWNTLKRQK